MTASTPTPLLFEFLDRSHQELQRQLAVLKRLVGQLAEDALTADGRGELKHAIAWFNTDARQHHLDEEKHVFPALLESSDAHVVHTTRRLRQDHGWIEENWLELAPSLEAAAGGYSWFDRDALAQGVEVFEQLCLDHLVLEESLAYPEARARIDPAELERAGAEMARRRSVREARPSKP